MKYRSNRAAFDRAIEAGKRRGLAAAAIHLQAAVKLALSKSAAGQAPPGSPPGVKTGTLRRSIQVDLSKNKGARPRVRVGSNVEYARIQELGGVVSARPGGLLRFKTPDGQWRTAKRVVLPARPYLRPTLKRERAAMLAAFKLAVAAELGKVGGV